MYRAHELWEDGLRVAKANGNQKELGEISIIGVLTFLSCGGFMF